MHLKKINQYSNEIAKIEADARDAAVKMEESFTKSQIARQKMIQVNILVINNYSLVTKLKWWLMPL